MVTIDFGIGENKSVIVKNSVRTGRWKVLSPSLSK